MGMEGRGREATGRKAGEWPSLPSLPTSLPPPRLSCRQKRHRRKRRDLAKMTSAECTEPPNNES